MRFDLIRTSSETNYIRNTSQVRSAYTRQTFTVSGVDIPIHTEMVANGRRTRRTLLETVHLTWHRNERDTAWRPVMIAAEGHAVRADRSVGVSTNWVSWRDDDEIPADILILARHHDALMRGGN